MDLIRLMNDLNNDTKYRFHLAKPSSGSRPLDALAKSKNDWLGWQVYRGTAKERFVTDFVVSFAQIEA